MLVHARYAVAWPQLGVTLVLAVLALEEAGRDPWRMWPLQGIAVALLLAAVAWCLDEPVPELARTTPRQPRWGLQGRALGLVPAVLAWITALHLVGGAVFGHRGDVLAQGLATVTAGLGGILLARAVGADRPARWCIGVVVPLLLALALVNPVPEWVPAFPYGPEGPWGMSRTLWALVAGVGVLALGLGLAEAPWWATRRRLRAPPVAGGALRRRPSAGHR